MKFKYIIAVFALFIFSGCDLFYPPQYYSDLVNKNSSSSSSQGSTQASWKKYYVSSTASGLNCVILTNNNCFLTGDAAGNVFTSIDGGTTWSSANVIAGPVYSLAWSASYNNVVVAGTGMGVYYNSGGGWTLPSGGNGTAHQVVYAGGMYIAAGSSGTSPGIFRAISSPDSSWSFASLAGATGDTAYSICYLSPVNQYFAVGWVSPSPVVFTNVPGNPSTWGQATPTPTACTNIAASGSVMVAVGPVGHIYYSPDNGLTWNISTSGTSENLNKVIWASSLGTFLAVGDNGTLLISANGITWAGWPMVGISFNAGENLMDIYYDFGRYIICTAMNNVYVSP